MSAKNKGRWKAIVAVFVLVASSVLSPAMNAYADVDGSGEEQAKNYLYVSAAYNCLRKIYANGETDNLFNDTVLYDGDLSSVFSDTFYHYGTGTVTKNLDDYGYIGKWLGDTEGNISCTEAINKTAAIATGNSKITTDAINSGLLKNIYSEISESVYHLYCVYPLIDSEGQDPILDHNFETGYNEIVNYQWPQGWYKKNNGEWVNKMSAPYITMLFGRNGGYRGLYRTGQDGDMNPDLETIIAGIWPATGPNADDRDSLVSTCNTVLTNTNTKIYATEDGYKNLEFTNSSQPFSYWGANYSAAANKAIFSPTFETYPDSIFGHGDSFEGLWATTSQATVSGSGSISAELTKSSREALQQLMGNIAERFFNSSTVTPESYLIQHPDLKYIIEGRYIFNGDANFSGGCGGYSISPDDPNYGNRDMNQWAGAIETRAYTGAIGTKTQFLTKINAGSQDLFRWEPNTTASRYACSALVAEFNELTSNSAIARTVVYGYINPATINGDGSVAPYNPGDPAPPETTDINCYTNAGALGWILCPIVESGGQFVEDVYDKFIEPQLVLDSGLFSQSNQGGQETYQAWQTFRNLANIAFVAVFLFVIFSQLTGFGIDNYGIKKILPKMIIAAIIVNASYIICQIAIDAANIIGYGIKNIMGGIGTVPSDTVFAIREGGHTLASIGSNVGIAAIVAALTVPAVLGQGVGILITVFTALIGIVVAILTLFVVLAARKALSLVLVVISPLAFLCYMLPNTKKLFNQWLNAMKGTLLAFPICAGMVFGGQAVSRIVMLTSGESSGTFFLTLIAAATAVAPIFLIPSVLKKSMGAISAVIDRASHGVSRFGKSHWQGSQSAKRIKEAGAAYQEEREVNRAKRALYGGRFNKGLMNEKELSRRQALAVRKHARTLNAYNKGTAEAYETIMESSGLDKANEVLMGTSDVNASIAALQKVNGIDAGATVESLRNYTNSEAFHNLNSADQMKFANACRAMKDNPMAQAYGKLLAESLGRDKRAVSWNDVEGETLNNKIRGLGNDALVNASKDILTSENLSRFSAEQIKTASTAHFSGDKLSKLNSALAGMDNARQEEVLSNMVDGSDWSNIRFDTLNALGGKARVDAMRNSGAYAGMERAISGLENAQELHASTDSDVLGALGIIPGAKEARARAQSQAAAQAQADAMKAQADALNELNQHLKAQNTNQYGAGDPNHHFPPSSFDGGNA